MIDLDIKQFIPRGSHVRNSGCLFLLVLYTGPETKLILNQGSYRFKQSHVDKMINIVLFSNLVVMFSFTIILALLSYSWINVNIDKHHYIFIDSLPAKELAGQAFGSFYLLNNSFLPLDLAVGLEMGRFMYIYYIERDAYMTIIDVDKK